MQYEIVCGNEPLANERYQINFINSIDDQLIPLKSIQEIYFFIQSCHFVQRYEHL